MKINFCKKYLEKFRWSNKKSDRMHGFWHTIRLYYMIF